MTTMTDRWRGPWGWRGVASGMFAVAWGANQFVSMLVAYRLHRGISIAVNDALFGVYAVGLIMALLLGGPAADIWGRARLVRPAVVVSIMATVLLMAGSDSLPLLFTGRFVAGVASGAIFAAGTAWVKELSTAPFEPGWVEDAGARRATIALSLGFGLGPLAAGIVAQWAPDPLVTAYLPHLVIALAALPLVWLAPETLTPGPPGSPVGFFRRLRVPSVRHHRFLGIVVPAAPWVFAAPAVAFAVLPSLVSGRTGGYAIIFAGAVGFLTLGVGVAVQPLARRLDRPGELRGATLALVFVSTGMVVAAVAAQTRSPVLVVVATLPLGAGYGMGLVSGLLETQRAAGPDDLAGLTAVYYALTYIGFGVPVLLAWLSHLASYPVLLCGLAVLAVLSLTIVRVQGRRPASAGPDAPGPTVRVR
jgi:MFS family permease